MTQTPALSRNGEPTVIGWQEYVALPDWGIRSILAKADTGARTSAIDVANIKHIDDEHVEFDVVPLRSKPRDPIHVRAPISRISKVKSSFGQDHDRYFVLTTMRIGPIEKEIELSLVCRKKMRCRMLLGRRTLSPEFLVDPARSYMFGRPSTRKKQSPPDRAPRSSKANVESSDS